MVYPLVKYSEISPHDSNGRPRQKRRSCAGLKLVLRCICEAKDQLLITSYLGDGISKMQGSRRHQNHKYQTEFFFKKCTNIYPLQPHFYGVFLACLSHTDLDTLWSHQGWLNTRTGCLEIQSDFQHWRYSQHTWSRPWVIWTHLKARSSQASRKPGAVSRALLESLAAGGEWGTSLPWGTPGLHPAHTGHNHLSQKAQGLLSFP